MKATFENSVNVLVRAFLNDTLQHMNCHACAIGNLVASANNLKYRFCGGTSMIIAVNEKNEMFPMNWFGENDEKEIASIGYTLNEVKRIESAFESASAGKNEDDHMYNGLMAVVDVLAKIHKVDLTVREEAKSMFVKELA